MATVLGSQISVIEEFVLQSNEVAVGAAIDTLVTKFNQEKYEEFLCTNSF